MKVLWIATKPPWPPVDGGRLVAWLTLQALAARGVELTLVSPWGPGDGDQEALTAAVASYCRPRWVASRPRAPLAAAWASAARRRPWTLARHRHPALIAAVAAELAAGHYDVVHAEQVQALAQAAPAGPAGVPVVLRCQNVESDLWAATAALHRPAVRGLLRWESARLAAAEGRAVAAVAAAVALTARDAERLSALAGGAGVTAVPAPFPAELPAAAEPLEGAPPVVLLGGGWIPNRDGCDWFLEQGWPALLAARPAARLHLFSAANPGFAGVVAHPALAESERAFAPGAILVVPLRIASGVRMKILEAWARGVPVVATPAAVAGLVGADAAVEIAEGAADLAAAVGRLAEQPGRAAALVAAGRRLLAAHHAPEAVARALHGVYQRAREELKAGR